jgi:hypothetical protein
VHPHQVGADRGVHEAREQWHTAEPQHAVGRVDPRADVGLEKLHRGAHDVEQQDDAELPERFEPGCDHPELDGDRGERQEVVPRERRVVGIPESRREQHGQQQRAEDAGPRLLEHERGELDERAADASGREPAERLPRPRVECELDARQPAGHPCSS